MPDDHFTLRQVDQARTDFAIIEDELAGCGKMQCLGEFVEFL